MNTLFVIVGSTGEYSDRTETVVGYVHTEDAAKDIVERLTQQRAMHSSVKPQERISAYAWFDTEGNEVEWTRFTGMPKPRPNFAAKPDAEAIEAANEQERERFLNDKKKLGLLDIEGPNDSYFYSEARLLVIE